MNVKPYALALGAAAVLLVSACGDGPVEPSLLERPRVIAVRSPSGAMVPEAVAAATELEQEGVGTTVLVVSSADRLYRDWHRPLRTAVAGCRPGNRGTHLDSLVPADERGRPVISVQDAASHSLAWLGSALGARQVPLGVDRFGESGRIADLHEITGISAAHIVNAALIAVADPR